jgi:hypothetical protein
LAVEARRAEDEKARQTFAAYLYKEQQVVAYPSRRKNVPLAHPSRSDNPS